MFAGMAMYIMCVMIMQPIMHYIMLNPHADGTVRLFASDPALYVIYGAITAGIFEESGRFVAFHLLKKKYEGKETALSYGIGYGAIEAILLAGITLITTLTMSAMINDNEARLALVAADDANLLYLINELIITEPAYFLTPGIERIITLSAHISLSIIVWCSVKIKGKLWLYPAAIAMHAIFNITPIMFQVGLIPNIWIVETTIFIFATLIAAAAFFACKIIKKEDTETL